jgi:hypothetical protein
VSKLRLTQFGKSKVAVRLRHGCTLPLSGSPLLPKPLADFEQLTLSSNDKQRLAINRLLEVFDNLDLNIQDRFDARPTQLRSVTKATAELILAIDRIQGKQSIVDERARSCAREVLNIA